MLLFKRKFLEVDSKIWDPYRKKKANINLVRLL